MRQENERKTERRDALLTVWTPALVAIGVMITGFVGTLMVLQLDTFRPRVGDIVAFRPNSQETDAWQLQVPATLISSARPGFACMLNPGVMAVNGGSLVVEARQETSPPLYQLHWAGTKTETGPSDCGAAADVTVTRTDLQKLANAAGGFGVGNKGLAR